jgi:rhamnogalacturonyl hydrolase YesR
MAAYQATGDQKFLDQCIQWGEDHNWVIPPIKKGVLESGANVLTCSQTWLECYFIKKDKSRIKPMIKHLVDTETKNPVNQPFLWYWEGGRRYVDALYVGPPALLMLYRATGDDIYLQWMESFFWDVYGKLFSTEDSLFYRDERFIQGYTGHIGNYFIIPDSIKRVEARRSYVYQITPNGKKVLWSRGNGWAFAGISRILKYFPKNHASYDRYLTLYRKIAYSLKKRQRENGYWPMNLDDPDDYPYPETSGTSFFTYGLLMGINEGWLLPKDFLPVVERSWAALCNSIGEDGKVRWGQPVGASPYLIYESDSHEFVTGMFLLAASEMYKLKN